MDNNNNEARFSYLNVIIVAIISGVFVLLWLILYHYLNVWIWQNNYVQTHRWVFPVLAISFSLIVGLAVKYFNAPNAISGSLLDSMKGGGAEIDWRNLPAAVVTSLASLLSGAVVGPEGAIGRFATDIAGWFNEKRKISKEHQSKIIYSSIASSYNGLIESPIFTAVLANDINENERERWSLLPSNLIAGAVGYAIFLIVGSAGFRDYLKLEQINQFKPVYILYIIVFALIGLALAVFAGICFRLSAKFFGKYKDKIILRSLIAGLIIGFVGYFFPVVMFSGETQVFTVLAEPAKYGIFVLFLMAFLKLILLSISFKSGFLGGPTFPSIFAATSFALAINLMFPQIPLILLVAGIMSGLVMAIFKTPFMVILLVTVFLSANSNLVALIILAVATVMLAEPILTKMVKKNKRL